METKIMRKTPEHFSLAIPVFAEDLSGDLLSDLAKIKTQITKSNEDFSQESSPKSNDDFSPKSSQLKNQNPSKKSSVDSSQNALNNEALKTLKNKALKAQIIDIRHSSDYAKKHIKNAKNITDFESLSREILSHKDTDFLLHCYSGYTVAMLGSELVKMGANNVFFFDEGFESLCQKLESTT
ncbi:rhodanese-like domain-containing protein [Helicobacter sp. T3_23-1056]